MHRAWTNHFKITKNETNYDLWHDYGNEECCIIIPLYNINETVNAQTDSVSIERYADKYPKLQLMPVNWSGILSGQQKVAAMIPTMSHTDWNLFSNTFVNGGNTEAEIFVVQ